MLPRQDAVIAITSAVTDGGIRNLVWDHILPAMKPEPLAADPAARKSLERTLSGLSLRPAEGTGSPSTNLNRTFVFSPNKRKLEAITLKGDTRGALVTLVAKFAGEEKRLDCPRGVWQKGHFAYGPSPDQPAAATCAWSSDHVFLARICFYQTPFVVTLRLEFSGNELLLDSSSNVSFTSSKAPRLIGKLAQ